jgi:hypothetical protein
VAGAGVSGQAWLIPPSAQRYRDQLLLRIRDAFANTSRSGGMSLQDAYAADRHGYLGPDDQTPLDDNHWWEVDLASGHSRAEFWHYLDAIGLRYYIPALMSSILTTGEDDWGVINILTSRWDGVDELREVQQEQESLLRDTQRACIAAFLGFMDAAGDRDAGIVRNNRWYDDLNPADEKAILDAFIRD